MPIKIQMLNSRSTLRLNVVICVTTKASNLVNDYGKGENTGLVDKFNLFPGLNGC